MATSTTSGSASGSSGLRRLVIVESPAKAKTIRATSARATSSRPASATSATCPTQRRRRPGQVQGRAVGPARASTSTTTSSRSTSSPPDKKPAGRRAQGEARQGRRRALPRHRRGPRGRGHRLAPAGGAQAEGAGPPDGLPRDHRDGDPRRGRATRATSTSDLVDAQETRRILDRLYGYEVSPGAVEEGRAEAVGRPGAVGGDPHRRRARARADGVPSRAGYWDIAGDLRRRRPSRAVHRDAGRASTASGSPRGRDFDRPRPAEEPARRRAPRRGRRRRALAAALDGRGVRGPLGRGEAVHAAARTRRS